MELIPAKVTAIGPVVVQMSGALVSVPVQRGDVTGLAVDDDVLVCFVEDQVSLVAGWTVI